MNESPRRSPDDNSFDAQLSQAREIALLREYLPLAAVADEPELREALQRTRRLAPKLAAASAARSTTGDKFEFTEHPDEYTDVVPMSVGGMGAVFRAQQAATGRIVAIKVIAEHRRGNAEAVRRFEREAALGRRIRHPHFVEMLDAGEDSGRPFLVMEFLDGRDLGRIAAEHGRLAVADACELIRQAALGADFLASQGLVHRDLKPSNLMLSGRPAVVKVLDMGLACDPASTSRSELTESQHILGSYDYLAPEQALDPRAVDRRADVYSLGCTLYRLLAGHAPFSREGETSAAAKLLAHQLAFAPALDSLRDDVPSTLAAVVARTMAKLPEDRFATAGDLAESLGPFCGGARLEMLLESNVSSEAYDPTASGAMDQTNRRSGVNRSESAGPNAFASKRPGETLLRSMRKTSVVLLATVALFALIAILVLSDRRREGGETVSVQGRPPGILRAPFSAETAHAAQRAWAGALGLNEPEIVNSLGMRLRLIPPGAFDGRSPRGDARAEHPLWMGVSEVEADKFAWMMGRDSASLREERPTSLDPAATKASRLPAQGVAWQDAVDFCRRLSDLPAERRAGRRYSLPTHAEWTWACLAGAAADSPWEAAAMRDHAVVDEPRPRSSGAFPANAFGLFDMRGNVAEWGADWVPEPPGGVVDAAKIVAAPPGGDTTGRSAGSPFLVPALRGGSYESQTPEQLSASRRLPHGPESPPRPSHGFRIVCRLDEPPAPRLPKDEKRFDEMIVRDTSLRGWGFPGGAVSNVDGELEQVIGEGSEWGSVWYGRHGNLRDFELRCDMRIEGGDTDCQIMFRADFLERTWERGSSYRFYLAGPRAGRLYRVAPERTAPVAVVPVSLLARVRFDTWNSLAVRCEGRRTRIWLADELAIDFTDVAPNVCLQGPLTFLTRGAPDGPRRTARFRDLRIRLLGTPTPAEVKPMEWTMGQENLPAITLPKARTP